MHPAIKTEFGLFPFRSPLLRKCRTQYAYIVFSSSWYWNVLLPRVRSFTSSVNVSRISTRGVASFGNFRIKACSAAPRNYRRYTTSFIASQKPRHPPYTLKFLIRKFKNHLTCFSVQFNLPVTARILPGWRAGFTRHDLTYQVATSVFWKDHPTSLAKGRKD